MKGIILNLLQTVVEDHHGEAAWDEVLLEAGADGAYTSLGNYPDREVTAVVQALAARVGEPAPEVLRWFGRQAIPHLARRYPAFFRPPDPVSFVVTLHDVIHAEVEKLYPGATPPMLRFTDVRDDAVTIEYRSHRAMSDLAIGFLEGAADWYGHEVEVGREVLDGAGAHVQLRCRFTAVQGAGADGDGRRDPDDPGGHER